jgi:alkane 1-monooxygenase
MTAKPDPAPSAAPRWQWGLSLVAPALPLGSALAYLAGAPAGVLWLTPACVYLLFPVLDVLLGEDRHDPSPSAPDGVAERWLVAAAVPVAWGEPGATGWLGLALSAGWASGAGINAAHELAHGRTMGDRVAALLALAPSGYGHFPAEHVMGRHREVATPGDVASARFGESYWAFMGREIPGALRRAWRLEADRLARSDRPVIHPANRNLQGWAMTACLWGGLVALVGVSLLTFLLGQAAAAWALLSAANYVEHYGLLRRRLPDGRYERPGPAHSWNSNRWVSNRVLYQLPRHADHHARPAAHWRSLRHLDGAPTLPTGYFGMFLLALAPPLWRRVMDPRVLALAGGDLSRVNRGLAT